MMMTNKVLTYHLKINDFSVDAHFSEENIKDIFLPMLQRFTELQKELKRRIIVYFAAPPGCGKSTLVTFLEDLSKGYPELSSLQAVGVDGFHYPNEYLRTHHLNDDDSEPLLIDIKGSPDTFDTEKLRQALIKAKTGDVDWPVYSREKHNVSNEVIPIREDIILLEGNYLLLDQSPWNTLLEYADYSVFIRSDIDALRRQLIDRKVQGGLDLTSAQRFYEQSDSKNVDLVLKKSLPAQLVLNTDGNFNFHVERADFHL